MGLKAVYTKFEVEFDRIWADSVRPEFDINVNDGAGTAFLSLMPDEMREVKGLIDAALDEYDEWAAERVEPEADTTE